MIYEVVLRDGTVLMVDNPSKMPDPSKIEEIREPIVTVNLYMPQEYVGSVITLCTQKRGMQINMSYHGKQVMLVYEMPMAEIVMDFFDKLKSVSRGYASMDYEFKEYRAADVVKVDMLINGEKVDALAIIVHRANSQYRGREVAAKMRELIPRQMYDVAIQATIGANIIARENVKAMRKNVLAKCYGGDISRKKKAAGKTEGRQEAHEAGGQCGNSAGGLPGDSACGRLRSKKRKDSDNGFCTDYVCVVAGHRRHLVAGSFRFGSQARQRGCRAMVGGICQEFLSGHPGGVFHSFLFDRAVQDTFRLDDSDPASRRLYSGE